MKSAPARIRRAEPSDLGAVVDLLNACDLAELGAPDTTVQDVENDWRADGFELATDAWVAMTNDQRLVGYAYTGDQFRSGMLETDFWVHPEHREDMLDGRLLILAERRARELARERGYGQAAEVNTFALAENYAKTSLLRRQGFALARTVFRMAVDPAAEAAMAPVPAGIVLEPFRSGVDDSALYNTACETFVGAPWRGSEPFEAWQERLEGHAVFDPALCFLAWEGEQVVGAALAYDHGDLGWIEALGVRPDWRRRGIGGALLGRALTEFAHRNRRRVELGLDAESGANPLPFYEQAGMHVALAYQLYVKRLARPAVSSS